MQSVICVNEQHLRPVASFICCHEKTRCTGKRIVFSSLAEWDEVVRKGAIKIFFLCDGEQVRMRAQCRILGNLHAVRRLCAEGGREVREESPFSPRISDSDFKIRRRLKMYGFCFGTRSFVKCKGMHAPLKYLSDDIVQVQNVWFPRNFSRNLLHRICAHAEHEQILLSLCVSCPRLLACLHV